MEKSKAQSDTSSTTIPVPETTVSPGTESTLSTFILPCYEAFHYFICIPSIPLFKFHAKSQKFTYKRIPLLRKLLGLSLTLLAALYYSAVLKLERAQATNSTLRVMSTLLYMNCILLVVISPLTLTNSAEKACEILNGIHELASNMGKKGATFPCKNYIRIVSASAIACGFVVMAMYALVSVDGQHGGTLREGPGAFALAVLNYNAKLVLGLGGINYTMEYGIGSEAVNWKGCVAAVAIFMFTWWASVLWAGEYLAKACWAVAFWTLLDRFMELVRKNPSSNLVKDIRTFKKIVALIEKFNEAFGIVTFLEVLCGGIHFSYFSYHVFKTTDNYLQQAVAIISFLWFVIFMSICASVHMKAGHIAKIIDDRYQDESAWAAGDDNCKMETTQGIVLLLHAVKTNSIGFQGLGFFTCTFPFFGTVLSAISTYGVIVLQYQD